VGSILKMKTQMNIKYLPALVLVIAGLLWGCTKTEIDDVPPVIIMNESQHFPLGCDTVYAGESFTFRATFTDNKQLGAFNIDIHHNFNHHSHSTEVEDCIMDPEKTATNNVFLFLQSYSIPAGLTTFEAEATIEIPANVDTGDYHFFLAVTDREGWQTVRGVGIKVMNSN
jgi:hypothetical protein